jgi:ketosteroid isomerase-like protein
LLRSSSALKVEEFSLRVRGTEMGEPSASSAPAGAAGATEDLQAMELRRLRALVDADLQATRTLHAPDFELVDPRGGVHGLEEYLGGLAAGAVAYRRFDPVSDIEVVVSGDLAVAHYRARIEVLVQGLPPQALEAWHTNCYRRAQDAGGWQLVWAQETAIAG